MPTIHLSLYLADKEYKEYLKRKKILNKIAREAVKEEIKKGLAKGEGGEE